jgi:hypothetical protein
MRDSVSRSLALFGALLPSSPSLAAQWWPAAELAAPNPQATAFLGRSVDVSGDTAVAGAPGDDMAAADAGAVHVFVESGSGWVEQAQLFGSDVTPSDHLGTSVALDGDTLVAGADSSGQTPNLGGEAYVFTRTRWCPSCPRPGHNPGPGATLRGQLWYRDPANTSNRTSSFSDAVEWTLAL